MIAPERLVLLDTNVLLLIARGKAAGRSNVERFGLHERPEKPLASVISLGELWRIAERRTWGGAQRDKLEAIGGELVVIGLEPSVVRGYGRLGAALDATGRPIPQNDLWIAATAAAKRATLLTTDRHFDPLAAAGLLDREFVDITTLPT